MGLRGQRHAPADVPPGKRPDTHCTGGCEDSRGRAGRVRKISPPNGIRSTNSPARSESYRCRKNIKTNTETDVFTKQVTQVLNKYWLPKEPPSTKFTSGLLLNQEYPNARFKNLHGKPVNLADVVPSGIRTALRPSIPDSPVSVSLKMYAEESKL